jgi:hypothetical protein
VGQCTRATASSRTLNESIQCLVVHCGVHVLVDDVALGVCDCGNHCPTSILHSFYALGGCVAMETQLSRVAWSHVVVRVHVVRVHKHPYIP